MIPINSFPKEFPDDTLSVIFLKVPGIERLNVLPLVCKDWHSFINRYHKNLIDLNEISKATFKNLEHLQCVTPYASFIKQYKKLKFYKLYGFKNSFSSWNTENREMVGKCYITHLLSSGFITLYFILNPKNGSFNFKKKHYFPQIDDLRLEYNLKFTSIIKSVERDSISLSSNVYSEINFEPSKICGIEKRKLNGWKKGGGPQDFSAQKEVLKYVEYFYNFTVASIVEYNLSLFVDTSIEDLESYNTLYCSRLGRVTKMENDKKFHFVIERIHLNSKQFRTLSWESLETYFSFSDGLDSVILSDVLSKTTHYLTHKLGLDFLDNL